MAECDDMRDSLKELFNKIYYTSFPEMPIRVNLGTQFTEYALDSIVDEMLANGVILLPCKVGDVMYKVCTVNSSIKIGQLWDGNVVKTNCDRCGYRNCCCYDIGLRKHDPDTMIDVIVPKTISSTEFAVKIIPYVGTVWFNTKESAEQAIDIHKQNGRHRYKNRGLK